MSERICPQCGAPIDPNAAECKFCGEKLTPQPVYQPQQPVQPQYQPQAQYQPQPQPQTVIVQAAQPQAVYVSGINPAWPIKSKVVAGILALLLGGIGIHKFYLGKIGAGIVSILFCWTGIPALVGFIEGLVYLLSNDENFQLKHHVRLG